MNLKEYRQRLLEDAQKTATQPRPTVPPVREVPEPPDFGVHRANAKSALSRAKLTPTFDQLPTERQKTIGAAFVRDSQGIREWLGILETYGQIRGGKGGRTLVAEAQRLRDFAAPMLDTLEAGSLPDAAQWTQALCWVLDSVERCRFTSYRAMPVRR